MRTKCIKRSDMELREQEKEGAGGEGRWEKKEEITSQSSSIVTILYYIKMDMEIPETWPIHYSRKNSETLYIAWLAPESQLLDCHLSRRCAVSERTAVQEVLCDHKEGHTVLILNTPNPMCPIVILWKGRKRKVRGLCETCKPCLIAKERKNTISLSLSLC